ncbi:chromosome segregation protein SMC [Gluconacetobacter johannae DSM 13595]|uniref:Chromosome partition protein Smc n=1 Tax=Gluconacetobacter johannae TaxID=112140 RepID=A0A7W4P311_9PROT|nr:AAA family ATPase [Gluconacetobacter johannae]MBB2175691.1 AAA family ATPase [Gluconacetobacter johannae]GBQ83215.1 chromosome segregation protein SMC [Gluconacetobacter johannae DSM 13595]
MTARFVRLRIVGFKSFADPVSVEILPGLTGIVGPNGCGKSNVVEALRWAMGESSARSLRGGEMDDLIFAGTAARAARNLAEVTLTLEGTTGIAPPPLHDQDELQISRRAERGAGSDYRVNSKPIRARDVQTLFADLASGARSSAMVSQGRVSALVNARPEERRSILEEAAGITGLHARRHEAELKLRATETNLSRADDLRVQLEGHLDNLRDQSQQARRYREISSGLREAETTLLALLHARARLAVERAGATARQARQALTQAEESAESAVIAEFEANRDIPALRTRTDESRTVLERQKLIAEGIAQEEHRAAEAASAATERLRQGESDHQAAQARQTDAQDNVSRLQAERHAIETRLATLPADIADADAALQAATAGVRAAEDTLERATADAGTTHSRIRQTAEAHRDALARHQRLETQYGQLAAQLDTLRQSLPDQDTLDAHAAALAVASETLAQARTGLEQATQAQADAVLAADLARNAAAEARRLHGDARQSLTQTAERATALHRQQEALQRRQADALSQQVAQDRRDALRDRLTAAESALATARAALEQAELDRQAASAAQIDARARVQEAGTRRAGLASALQNAESAHTRAVARFQALDRDLAQARAGAVDPDRLIAARVAREQAEQDVARSGQALDTAEADLAARTAARDTAAQHLSDVKADLSRLEAQADGLTQALAADEGDAGIRGVVDDITVPDGLEAALAAALADGLDASIQPDTPRLWHRLPEIATQGLPGHGTVPLSTLVTAPPALARALGAIGLLADGEDGAPLQVQLHPGQSLVRRDGAFWRWDGYRLAPGLPSRAALLLQQRNRLRETTAALAARRADLPAAQADQAATESARAQAAEAVTQARAERTRIEAILRQTRADEAEISRLDATVRARLDTVLPQHEQAVQARTESEAALAAARQALSDLPDEARLRHDHDATRQREQAAQAAESAAREARRQAETTLEAARRDAGDATARHDEAETRLATIVPELERIVREAEQAEAARQAAEQALSGLPPVQDAETALAAAQSQVAQTTQALDAARQYRLDAEQALEQAQSAQSALQTTLIETRSAIEAQAPRLATLAEERDDAAQTLARIVTEQATLPDPDAIAEQIRTLRQGLATARQAEDTARERRAALAGEDQTAQARLAGLRDAIADWSARHDAAAAEAGQTAARLDATRAEHARLSALPDEVVRTRETTREALLRAEAAHEAATGALAAAEAALSQAQAGRRDADAALATAREGLLRAEGRHEQAEAILTQLLTETPEPPGVVPPDLTEAAESSLRRKIARLAREREDMGPVNLRAELEADEAETRIAVIQTEKDELETAIARLRGSIGALNREGRERLLAVFTEVDQHFQALFARMFNGGRAHLGMVGNDDPLQAGLEIYAQPPGKKLATLSLLSGGEQALTALSLIFAVFRCNPAPICVLDEVDAPLDDANVGRFCALLGDMVAEAGTRFLVVTHHQLTMAHMDRLYGVTMQERGVSRVLSVDLEHASTMAGQARANATA